MVGLFQSPEANFHALVVVGTGKIIEELDHCEASFE